MKRTKKTLIGLLLSIMLVLGLIPTMAFADGEGPQEQEPVRDNHTFGFQIVNTVKQGGTVAPGDATFTFILNDKNGTTPAAYGISMQDIKITTNGEEVVYNNVSGTIDPEKVTTGNGWTKTLPNDPDDNTYSCSFVLKEQNDGAEGWKYSEKQYNLHILYNKNAGTTVTIRLPGEDASVRTADFTNIYTKHKSAGFTFRVVKTVKQGGTAAPGKATFSFILNDKEGMSPADYGITMPDNTITTNGAETTYKDLKGTIDLTKVKEENGWRKILDDPNDGGYVYRFVLKEQNDSAANWSYSEKQYTIQILCDTKLGTASATIYLPNEEDVSVRTADFTNTFTKDAALSKSDPAKPQAPKTGDDSNQMLWIMLLLGSGAAALVVFSRKRKSLR